MLNCLLTPSQGRYTFDPVSRLLSWEMGRVEQAKLPNLRGNLSLQTGAPPPDANPAINLKYVLFSSQSLRTRPGRCTWGMT